MLRKQELDVKKTRVRCWAYEKKRRVEKYLSRLEWKVDGLFGFEPVGREEGMEVCEFDDVAERMRFGMKVATFKDDEAIRHGVLVAMVDVFADEFNKIG